MLKLKTHLVLQSFEITKSIYSAKLSKKSQKVKAVSIYSKLNLLVQVCFGEKINHLNYLIMKTNSQIKPIKVITRTLASSVHKINKKELRSIKGGIIIIQDVCEG